MVVGAGVVAEIACAIAAATAVPFRVVRQTQAGGGCINEAITLAGEDGRRFFVKLNQPERVAMFAAESAGLMALRQTSAMRVPQPIAHGVNGTHAWLALEWLDLAGEGNTALLGRQLADLHRNTADRFGWHQDNTLGTTPQPNGFMPDWVSFFREQRLGYQLHCARMNGASTALLDAGGKLMRRFEALFEGYTPIPSLLHGDLWQGNYAFVAGEPVIFDPAVYFGDRETDLAMTELFGGFPQPFYQAYNEAWPLHTGYQGRRDLYQLYHILNHFNLFGGHYAAQAQLIIQRLLARLA